MKLYYSPTSPYVRKVRVLLLETGLDDKVERTTCTASPIQANEALNADNPLGKVPALVTGDGEVLFDSPVICEFLDSLHDGAKMFPAAGAARWTALRRQALADGILDAALLCRYENAMRPGQFHWPEWEQGQMGKITRGLDALEGEAESLQGVVDIGAITIGCALGYLDFRFGGLDWRRSRPRLAAWYGEFAQRPSMQETVPPQ